MELPAIARKCHYGELTPEETDEVVNAVADLIVDYITGQRKAAAPEENTQEGTHERKQTEIH